MADGEGATQTDVLAESAEDVMRWANFLRTGVCLGGAEAEAWFRRLAEDGRVASTAGDAECAEGDPGV